jgi:hypothetical protein
MSPQMIVAITYVPFVILIGMSCFYKGRAARILKIISTICLIVATFYYIVFIKNLL